MPVLVTRCVCADVTFAELTALASATGAGVRELCERTGCGQQCGMCLPYIRVALATGEAAVPLMSEAQLAAAEAAAQNDNGPDA